MAVIVIMRWKDVTPGQYEQARELVNWERDVPAGVKTHVAAFADDGLRVVDIWDSAEAAQTFFETRLTPGCQQLGLAGEPEVEILPVYASFNPNP